MYVYLFSLGDASPFHLESRILQLQSIYCNPFTAHVYIFGSHVNLTSVYIFDSCANQTNIHHFDTCKKPMPTVFALMQPWPMLTFLLFVKIIALNLKGWYAIKETIGNAGVFKDNGTNNKIDELSSKSYWNNLCSVIFLRKACIHFFLQLWLNRSLHARINY